MERCSGRFPPTSQSHIIPFLKVYIALWPHRSAQTNSLCYKESETQTKSLTENNRNGAYYFVPISEILRYKK